MAKVKSAKKKSIAAGKPSLRFYQRLVLFHYLLDMFGVDSLEQLASGLKDLRFEGLDADNTSLYYHQLTAGRLFETGGLTADILLQYDQNIVRHTRMIQGRRVDTLRWKYFQYLSLLFTEIYLDRYFRDADALLKSLNTYVQKFNNDKDESDQIKEYTAADLSKLAFWNATGSGKTLLMHVNILQYRHYLLQAGRERELNKIILLTPNEGLSRQHLAEFAMSDMPAELFDKAGGGLFNDGKIEIIDINKLKEDMGQKTVAVDAFESNNLLLVDEGHRGSSGDVWKGLRDRLCSSGFSFEYSATFGQAMKASGKPDLIQEYARCILFDYSYKYFYQDGYGKDYKILNLSESGFEEGHRPLYLTACLLSYYQQLKIFADKGMELAPYLLEKPLWVFVGKSVTATSKEGEQEVSDVVEILQFMAQFVGDKETSSDRIGRLLSGDTGLNDTRGRDLFSNAFSYIAHTGLQGDALFRDILAILFNNPVPGAALHLDNLKGVQGEIGVRLGEGEYFGVINVGADKELLKLCGNAGLSVDERDFSVSLFQQINERSSSINILIGSKKFSEGWSSWRVSTMGLLNVGKKEGSEIIQLFGRGVRLKGYDMTLKRSRIVRPNSAPAFIGFVETLNVFGVRAEYMKQFQEYLEEEGLPPEKPLEIRLPVLQHWPAKQKLKVLRVREGLSFKKDGPKPILAEPPKYLKKNRVVLNWYPKIQARIAAGAAGTVSDAALKYGVFDFKQLEFLDWEAIYFELIRYKNEKSRNNLHIPRNVLKSVMTCPDWYTLFIPEEDMMFTSFGKVRQWQEIVTILLKKYCDRFYAFQQKVWELENLEYADLTADDPNLVSCYDLSLDATESTLLEKLHQLVAAMTAAKEAGSLAGIEFHKYAHHLFHPIGFGGHLFEPLLCLLKGQTSLEIKPVPLNKGEMQFVLDLKQDIETRKAWYADKEVYLLRNQSGGRGAKFFAGDQFFEPDFLLWVFWSGKQYLTFIDPKGISHSEGLYDPKIQFSETIKSIEEQLSDPLLGDPSIALNSFIISVTPYETVKWWGDAGEQGKKLFRNRNVLFQEDEGYVKQLLGDVLA